jgi:hypothetical protein
LVHLVAQIVDQLQLLLAAGEGFAREVLLALLQCQLRARVPLGRLRLGGRSGGGGTRSAARRVLLWVHGHKFVCSTGPVRRDRTPPGADAAPTTGTP